MLATYNVDQTDCFQKIDTHIQAAGFETNTVGMDRKQLAALVNDVDRLGLWDDRQGHDEQSDVLLASPWGFRWLRSTFEFDSLLPKPLLDVGDPAETQEEPKDSS